MLIVAGLTQVLVIACSVFFKRPVLWTVVAAGSILLAGVWGPLMPMYVGWWIGPLFLILTALLAEKINQKHYVRIAVIDRRIQLTRQMTQKSQASLNRTRATNDTLEQNALEVASLYELTKSMNTSLEFVDIFEIFSGTLRRTFDFETAKLILVRTDPPGEIDRVYQIQKVSGQHPVIAREEKRRVTLIDRELRSHPNAMGVMQFDRQIVREVRECMDAILVTNGIREPRTLKLQLPKDIHAFVAVPLRFEGSLLGVLTMENFTDEVFERFAILAGQLAMEIKKAKLYETIQALALIDGLTGVFRRRHFLERYREEFERSRKRGFSLAVLMLDLDWFKKYNDKHGHLVGDSGLREIARITKENLRAVDLAGRLGGEEFCIALPETDKAGAQPVAERVREAIARHVFKAYDEATRLTVSIGVASFPDDADRPQGLIECADEALYQAKRAGRNRVMVYKES